MAVLSNEQIREILAPTPKVSYPTPWGQAEQTPSGEIVVVDADGSYVCNASSEITAEIIVKAVNDYYQYLHNGE